MRLRMKVWTDPDTGTRYLMPAAFITKNTVLGAQIMKAYAMNDDSTKVIELNPEEWDRLPFFYFKEDGECTLDERPKRGFDLV